MTEITQQFEPPYQPKTNDRYFMLFPKEFGIHHWLVSKINKPKFTNGKWENIEMEFLDPIRPSASKGLYKIVDFLTNTQGDNRVLFDITIQLHDACATVVEEWVISVEKVLTIDFGDLDYANYEHSKPRLIIQPLYCVLNDDFGDEV